MHPDSNEREIIYVGDPMCSWCWGFAPVLRAMRDEYSRRCRFSVLVGGLRPGTTQPLDAGLRATIRHHWQEVHRRTGQPFDFAMIDTPSLVYDTEPACRAVVVTRHTRTDLAFDFFERLHRAFYAENQDISRPAVLAALAEEMGLDRETFEAEFDAEATILETQADFAKARRLGVMGFPTVLLVDHAGHHTLTRGYQPFESLQPRLESWLAGA